MGSSKTVSASSQLKRLLSTHEAYRVLDATAAKGGTWTAGGCAILALAILDEVQGAELMGIYDRGVLQHVCVRAGGTLIDADGTSSSEYAFLLRWRADERLHDPELRPLTRDSLRAWQEIPSTGVDVERVSKFLRTGGVIQALVKSIAS